MSATAMTMTQERVGSLRLNNAITLPEHVAKISLKDELATMASGCTAFDSGDFENALSTFLAIADTSKIYFNIAMTYCNVGEMNKAVANLDEAVELDSHLAVAYFQRGVIWFMDGGYEEALSDFDMALVVSTLSICYIV